MGDVDKLTAELNKVRHAVINKEGVDDYADNIMLLLSWLDKVEQQGLSFDKDEAPQHAAKYVLSLKELYRELNKVTASKKTSRGYKDLVKKVTKCLGALKQKV